MAAEADAEMVSMSEECLHEWEILWAEPVEAVDDRHERWINFMECKRCGEQREEETIEERRT